MGFSGEPAELVHHSTCCVGPDPNIAIDYPHQIAFCFAVGATHVSDLGIGAQIRLMPISSGKVRIFIFDEYSDIESAEVIDKALQSR